MNQSFVITQNYNSKVESSFNLFSALFIVISLLLTLTSISYYCPQMHCDNYCVLLIHRTFTLPFGIEKKKKDEKRTTLAICLIYQHKFYVSSFKWSTLADKVFGINISLFQWFDKIKFSSCTHTHNLKYKPKHENFDGFPLAGWRKQQTKHLTATTSNNNPKEKNTHILDR